MRGWLRAALPAAVVLLASPATGSPVAAGADARKAEAQRAAKESYFRSNPWSPLRAFERYDFSPAGEGEAPPSAVVGSNPSAEVRLDAPGIAPRQLRITVLPPVDDESTSRFRIERLAPGGEVRIEGKPLPDGVPNAAPEVAEETLVEVGPFAIRPYVQSDAGILILFDARRTSGGRFVPPVYFPFDPTWRFRVPLVRLPSPEPVAMQTSLGRTKEYNRIGYFELPAPADAASGGAGTSGGKAGSPAAKIRVTAYRPLFVKQGEESLSILFTDRTTGKETYGTGRYLDLAAPEQGLYTLDFNAAYNPLCAYTHVYNCPIPPAENALPVAVRAGEKTYPHQDTPRPPEHGGF